LFNDITSSEVSFDPNEESLIGGGITKVWTKIPTKSKCGSFVLGGNDKSCCFASLEPPVCSSVRINQGSCRRDLESVLTDVVLSEIGSVDEVGETPGSVPDSIVVASSSESSGFELPNSSPPPELCLDEASLFKESVTAPLFV